MNNVLSLDISGGALFKKKFSINYFKNLKIYDTFTLTAPLTNKRFDLVRISYNYFMCFCNCYPFELVDVHNCFYYILDLIIYNNLHYVTYLKEYQYYYNLLKDDSSLSLYLRKEFFKNE